MEFWFAFSEDYVKHSSKSNLNVIPWNVIVHKHIKGLTLVKLFQIQNFKPSETQFTFNLPSVQSPEMFGKLRRVEQPLIPVSFDLNTMQK